MAFFNLRQGLENEKNREFLNEAKFETSSFTRVQKTIFLRIQNESWFQNKNDGQFPSHKVKIECNLSLKIMDEKLNIAL